MTDVWKPYTSVKINIHRNNHTHTNTPIQKKIFKDNSHQSGYDKEFIAFSSNVILLAHARECIFLFYLTNIL